MTKRRLKLVFPPELIREPIIYRLGQQFNVVTNILRTNVEIDKAWVIVELNGDEKELGLGHSILANCQRDQRRTCGWLLQLLCLMSD